jgi:hypothetical protein
MNWMKSGLSPLLPQGTLVLLLLVVAWSSMLAKNAENGDLISGYYQD